MNMPIFGDDFTVGLFLQGILKGCQPSQLRIIVKEGVEPECLALEAGEP